MIQTSKIAFLLVVLLAMTSACGVLKKKSKPQETREQLPMRPASSAELIYKDKFYEALRLRTVGDNEAALKQLEVCLVERPNDDAVLYLLASYAEETNRHTKSKKYIERALSIDPNNIWYTELHARQQLATTDFVGAEQSFAQLHAFDRYNKEWMFYYSEALIYNQKYEQALIVIDDLIDEVGPVPELVNQRNQLYVELGKENDMIESLKKLINQYPESPEFASMLVGYYLEKKQYDEAENMIQKMMDQDPTNAALSIAMADVQKAKGNTAGAYVELKKAFESNSLDVENSLEMMLSILERSTKLDPEVLELAQILQRNHPEQYMTHVIVGDIYKNEGNYLKSVEAFETALNIEKNNFQLWQEVVSLHYLSCNYNIAFTKAEGALELHPSQPLFYYYAGVSAMKINQFDDAQAYLNAGKDVVVRDQAMKAQFELSLAELQLAQKKIPQARKYLDKVQQLAPDDKLMMNNRAYLMATYKLDLDIAFALIQSALQGNERDPLFLDTEAWVYFARNDFNKALESIQKAYQWAPKNQDINEHYGDILFMLGKVDEALGFWKKSQELGNLKPELSNKIKNKKL